MLELVETRILRHEVAGYQGPRFVNSSEDAVLAVRELFSLQDLGRENVVALGLDTKLGLVAIWRISTGSLNASIVHPRESFAEGVVFNREADGDTMPDEMQQLFVMEAAQGMVQRRVAAVLFIHNHPSGDPSPSRADRVVYRRLMAAGDVLGIDVLDFLTVGEGESYFSLNDEQE